jgi:hypothetical protein
MCFSVNKYLKRIFFPEKFIISSTFQPPNVVGGGTKGDILFVKLNDALFVIFFNKKRQAYNVLFIQPSKKKLS